SPGNDVRTTLNAPNALAKAAAISPHGVRDAESTTMTSTGSSSRASAPRHPSRSAGRSCVQTMTDSRTSVTEHLREERRVLGAAAIAAQGPAALGGVPGAALALAGVAEREHPASDAVGRGSAVARGLAGELRDRTDARCEHRAAGAERVEERPVRLADGI